MSYLNSKLSLGIMRSPPFRPDPLDQFSFVLTQLLTWKPTINYITKFKRLNLSNFNTNVGTFILSNSGKQMASPGSPSRFCHPTAGQCIPMVPSTTMGTVAANCCLHCLSGETCVTFGTTAVQVIIFAFIL